MTCTRTNNEMRIGQLMSQLLGHLQGSGHVVVAPDQLDGTPHCSQRRGVILGKSAHENVPHDARGRAVVIGPVAPP